MKRDDLTPKQREIVESTDASFLVYGGAGTGKTTAAVWAAREQLEEASQEPFQRVLFLTFSRTAVAQIARRSHGALGPVRDRVEIATFHGFAYRLVTGFGRYVGLGSAIPDLQSPSRVKLLGHQQGALTYDDLMPQAIRVLESDPIADVARRRWPLVICDEFQDTSPEQWRLLQQLTVAGRMILLADPNQMIYTFVPGVGEERLSEAMHSADRVVHLEPASHRDPSGVIPAMAEAVRQRQFDHEALDQALTSDRLRVISDTDEETLGQHIADQVDDGRSEGLRSYGVYGHSNQGVAELGVKMADVGLDYSLVGIPEAQAEALAAQAALTRFAVGEAEAADVALHLALFLTSCTRGQTVPPLAVSLAQGGALPRTLEQRLDTLLNQLRDEGAGSLEAAVEHSATAWQKLGIARGDGPWKRGATEFRRLARRLSRRWGTQDVPQFAHQLDLATDAARADALVSFDGSGGGPIQLMNYQQTKGRETDVVIFVHRAGDFIAGYESAPFVQASRLLYVVLTRAKRRVVLLLPKACHDLVSPFLGM